MSITLVAVFIALSYGYQDKVPNRDFMEPVDDDQPAPYINVPENSPETKISGYFKYVVRETLKSNVLSEAERQTLMNTDFVDPQDVAEILAKLVSNKNDDCGPSQYSISSCFIDYALYFPKPLFFYTLVATYCFCAITIAYYFRSIRFYLIWIHGLLFYSFAVFSKINNDFLEHQSLKLTALRKDIPASCEGKFSLLNFFTVNRIGDECQKYYHSVLQEPIYQINYGKCFSYPLWSLVITFVTLILEELSHLLPKLLEPFPIYLQISVILLLFALFLFLSLMLAYGMWSAKPNPVNNDFNKLVAEVRAIKAEMVDKAMINDINNSVQSLEYKFESATLDQTQDIVVVQQEGNMAAVEDQREVELRVRPMTT